MSSSRYALVSYVHNAVGKFVEDLRRELHPDLPHMAAHLTILPPREVVANEEAAVEFLEEACSRVLPFDVELGEVTTFLPVTPTVFIKVTRAADRMRELHDQLSVNCLGGEEEWPYMPHLTIIKTKLDEQARRACTIAQQRWSRFKGLRRIHVDELMFVRENGERWEDVAPVPLGRRPVSTRR